MVTSSQVMVVQLTVSSKLVMTVQLLGWIVFVRQVTGRLRERSYVLKRVMTLF